MKNKIKLSRYEMTKKPVVSQEAILARKEAIKNRMDVNQENINRLLAQKDSLVVRFYQGDSIKTYHRTPEDIKNLKWTIKNLEIQNTELKKELEILRGLTKYEWA